MQIHWLGGEPFFHKRFAELFDKAALNPNLRQILVTNGLLVDEKWAKKLLKSNVEVIFSIDGTTKQVYEKIRIGASFDRLIKNIDILNQHRQDYTPAKSKMNMILQATIVKSNYHQLADFVEFAHKYKFDSLNITPVRYFEEEENIFHNNDKKALKYIEAKLPEVFKKAKGYGLKILNVLPKNYPFNKNIDAEALKNKCAAELYKKPSSKSGLLCHWPWKSLFILNYGRVKPYGYCEEHIGNVTGKSLKEIWNGKSAVKYRKKILENKCLNWCSARCTSGVMPEENLKLKFE